MEILYDWMNFGFKQIVYKVAVCKDILEYPRDIKKFSDEVFSTS